MFLIFHELRPDILPVDDIGLQKAVALHYHDGERPVVAQMRALGARWPPYRSVATWYLWRSLDPIRWSIERLRSDVASYVLHRTLTVRATRK